MWVSSLGKGGMGGVEWKKGKDLGKGCRRGKVVEKG